MDASEILRPGDKLQITFRAGDSIQFSHEESIPDSGGITLPNLPSARSRVPAAGKTRVQLEEDIRNLYVPDVYQQLSVTIAPTERFFYISGEVNNEARHQYLGKLTLTQAIATAQGFTDWASKKNIQITRTNGKVLRADYTKALEDPTIYDIIILPGDQINVPRRRM